MVDFQLMGGYRNATFELGDSEYDLASPEVGAALHIAPIKKLPLALGVSYMYIFSDDKDTEENATELNIDNFEGYEAAVELYFWYDIKLGTSFTLKPYLKGSYIFDGEYRFDLTNVKAEYDVTGWYAAVGIGDNGIFIPSLSGLIELGIPILELYKPRFNDIEVDPAEKLKYKAWEIKLVVELMI